MFSCSLAIPSELAMALNSTIYSIKHKMGLKILYMQITRTALRD